MKRIRDLFLGAIELLAVISIFVMMVHVSLNALTRSFFSAPIFGTLEMTSFWYLPLVAALGFIAAQLRKEHITAELVYDALPRPAKLITAVLTSLLSAGVSGLFFWFGLQDALHSLDIGKSAGNTDHQVWPFQLATALSFAFLAGSFVVQIIGMLRQGEAPTMASAEDEIEEFKDLENKELT